MKSILALLLLSTACTTTDKFCYTTAGMRASGAVDDAWCEELQSAEDSALVAFERVVTYDLRFKDAAQRLHGMNIVVTDERGPIHPQSGERVGGYTSCDDFTIYVGNPSPRKGSVVHEMAHAIQRCVANPLNPRWKEVEFHHENWGLFGIHSSINEVRHGYYH